MMLRRGVTRTVWIGNRYAVKVPWGYGHSVLRGWLANRSEWRQRHRPEVARPILTLGHFALVFPAAQTTFDDRDDCEHVVGPWQALRCDHEDDCDCAHQDEAKPSSWGWFFGVGWRLIDFDRAWQDGDRGIVGAIYYGRQERMARKWAAL